MRMAGILSGPAEELVFRFRMIFRIAGILKTVSDIIIVLGGYVGGSSPLSSRFELNAKYEAKASALSGASMTTELTEWLRGGSSSPTRCKYLTGYNLISILICTHSMTRMGYSSRRALKKKIKIILLFF